MRMNPDDRREMILDAAVRTAKKIGWRNITRDGVAVAAQVSGALVTRYFGDIKSLRTEVMRVAVRDNLHTIVADGLAAQHPVARRAHIETKQKALAHLAR